MKKKILIIAGIILVLIVAIIAYTVVTDMKQEEKLAEEFKYIDGVVEKEETETDEIKEALERTVTTRGDYLKTEKAYKHLGIDYQKSMFD